MNTAEALDRLLLYRQTPESLLRRLMDPAETVRTAAQAEVVALAVENGWQGDLWRCCIAWTLTEHENPFSLSWERRTGPEDTLSALALADMAVFHALLSAPPEEGPWPLLRNFHHESRQGKESAPLTELAAALADAASPAALLDCLTAFYQSHGVGPLGLGQVFRVRREADGVRLLPVRDRPPVRLADLVGYRQQKEQLVRNTEAFLHGRGGNNVLLYGDAGTGKSTSVQAIANEYAAKGLRLIEVYKEQYDLIPALLRQIKGRNYRFLLFLDDLSFEENETSYKYLKAVMEGGAEAVMTSYNEINGIPAIVNDEVRHVLKGTYGLPGHVVCDGGDFSQTVNDHHFYQTHGETLANGLKAGVDCFTDDGEIVYDAAREALDNGWITEKDIDESVRNSFRTRIRLGMFDKEGDCPYQNMGEEYINNEEHQELARKMAAEAVVLLKNENEILPLDENAVKNVAVVGPLSDVWYKDWYCGIPPYAVTVLDGIKEAFPNAKISPETGLSEIRIRLTDQTGNNCYVGLDENTRLKLVTKEQAETFILNDWGCGSMTLVAKSNGRFVTLEEDTDIIKADKKEAFGWFVRELWNLKREKSSFTLESWNKKQVIVDKDGHFSICVDNPPARFEIEIVKDGKTAAEKTVKGADHVIAVIGCNPVINSKEEVDRTTIALPPEQEELVKRVAAVNPNTIVALISNYPYAIGELEKKVPAILLSASGSQELGHGIADVLTGKAAAAGRLNMTWYRSDEDLPDMNDYDIIQGKRTYQYFDREVLYPFGYGLTYAAFSYEKMQIKKERGCIKVSCFIKNTGERSADEIVQLYVHKKGSRVQRPIRQLVGFERIHDIQPKETRKVTFMVQLWECMILEDGTYQFMAGASSQDIRLEQSIEIDGTHAGKRNPFQATAADCYDAYDHMFLHRGINGSSCVIPGCAGDDPDEMKKQPVSGKLIYHDFVFSKKPLRLNITLKVLEPVKVTVTGKNVATVTAEPVDCYRMLEMDLPENFIETGKPETIQIQVEGKCKISKFVFA